ncbi:MAG TPA: hypothetical protein PLR32_00865 [candidate division Zixibacteria bacterium]|nr:hypothetical protein [candidate division Zixibacteria bacterium]MDD4916972.1 hypothetical protein [candidate division Zixibacteria bacterium]MDM7974168.1 hypothetical protein [candidate division Zixibacteria bacterium]HOD67592.1 hypothetical protein [candidate division Zixibacteria bacterium]HOZ06780.1 hypothetical protein [candidate division Zixibacteria bacterium]
MRRTWVLVLVALAAGLTAGCFDYEEQMVIDKDGSGKVSFHYAVNKEYLQQFEDFAKSMAALAGEDSTEVNLGFAELSEDSIRQAIAQTTEGVELVSYRASEDEANKIWDMTFTFADLNAAAGVSNLLTPDDEEGDATGLAEAGLSGITFERQPDGTWLYRRPLESGSDEEEPGMEEEGASADEAEEGEATEPEEAGEAPADETVEEAAASDDAGEAGTMEPADVDSQQNEFAKAFAGHKVRFIVTFPGKVIESNASTVDGNMAIWEYSLDAIPALQEMRAVVAD